MHKPLERWRPYLLESGADGGGSFSLPAFIALCLFLLVVGSWLWSAGRMFFTSASLFLGGEDAEAEGRPAPVLPIVVDKSNPTVQPLVVDKVVSTIAPVVVVSPTVEPVEMTPTPEPAVVEVVAGSEPPGRGGAQVTSTAPPGCEVYCQVVAYCAELERLNPGCVVVWPEEE